MTNGDPKCWGLGIVEPLEHPIATPLVGILGLPRSQYGSGGEAPIMGAGESPSLLAYINVSLSKKTNKI